MSIGNASCTRYCSYRNTQCSGSAEFFREFAGNGGSWGKIRDRSFGRSLTAPSLSAHSRSDKHRTHELSKCSQENPGPSHFSLNRGREICINLSDDVSVDLMALIAMQKDFCLERPNRKASLCRSPRCDLSRASYQDKLPSYVEGVFCRIRS
jgi:hypothetical protein